MQNSDKKLPVQTTILGGIPRTPIVSKGITNEHILKICFLPFPIVYVDLVYKFKRIVGKPCFDNQFKGQRPVIVKKVLIGSKSVWKLSTIFKVEKCFAIGQ